MSMAEVSDYLDKIYSLFVGVRGRLGDSLVVNDLVDRRLSNGDKYEATVLYENVADDTTVTFFFENPEDSSVRASIVGALIAVEGKTVLSVYDNVEQTSAGTDITEKNKQVGSSKTSSMTTESGGSFDTSGITPAESIIPAGTLNQRLGTIASQTSLEVLPGNNILLELRNESLRTIGKSVSLVFIEEDNEDI